MPLIGIHQHRFGRARSIPNPAFQESSLLQLRNQRPRLQLRHDAHLGHSLLFLTHFRLNWHSECRKCNKLNNLGIFASWRNRAIGKFGKFCMEDFFGKIIYVLGYKWTYLYFIWNDYYLEMLSRFSDIRV